MGNMSTIAIILIAVILWALANKLDAIHDSIDNTRELWEERFPDYLEGYPYDDEELSSR